MSKLEHPGPSEEQIQDKLFFEILPKRYPDSLTVKNWMGWSYRAKGERKEQTRFYREFDVALFERKTQAGIHSLVLTGFEIKGFEQESGKLPAFAEGLDQALVLLHQGADYSYLVHPLFLGSMGELGAENLVLSLFRKHPGCPDKELIEKSKLSRGTFYRYKRILQERGQI